MADFDEKEGQRRLDEIYKKRLRDRKIYNNRWRQKRESAPAPLSFVLESHFRKDPQALRQIEESRAIQAWYTFVGEPAAQVSRPLRIRGSKLVVQVTDPMWRQQLLLLRYKILNKYHQHFPKLPLTDIFFVAY